VIYLFAGRRCDTIEPTIPLHKDGAIEHEIF
jgi:hypothetical protein